MRCPNCKSSNIVLKGKRRNKQSIVQRYFCNGCGRYFSSSKLKGYFYNPKIVVSALALYNQAYTLNEVSRVINRKFKVRTSSQTVHSWIEKFRDVCLYKSDSKDVIVSRLFKHHGLTYNFAYHKEKLDKAGFKWLAFYIKKFEREQPPSEYFDSERCSQLRLKVGVRRDCRRNWACRLAEFALKGAEDNCERHGLVESFMLAGDKCTVAVEVPVWFWEKKLGLGVCGHIDILQVRNGMVYVLDYKPDAAKVKEVASQLYLYALGLSLRTRIGLGKFRCAWFDADDYFEFEPAEARVEWSKGR